MPPKSTPRNGTLTRGITVRHEKACPRKTGSGRCSCSPGPAFSVRVRYGPRGGERVASKTFHTEHEAVAWRDATARAIEAGEDIEAARRQLPTIGEAARSFIARARTGDVLARNRRPYSPTTITNYEGTLTRYVLSWVHPRSGRALEDTLADRVTTRVRQAMVDHIAKTSPATARIADAAVCAVLRELYVQGVLDELPGKTLLPPPPKPRSNYLTHEQATRLMDAAKADDAERGCAFMSALVAVLAGTGLRISEALALTWGPDGIDLDASPAALTVPRATTKSDAGERTISIPAADAWVLRRHYRESGKPKPGALVFTNADGTPTTRHARARSGMERVAKAAGITGFRVNNHLFRHSHASWLADGGEPAVNIAARLGHADSTIAERHYIHPRQDKLAEVPDALAWRDDPGAAAG